MKESIHKYFQVGTIQWMSFPKRDPMESLKAIARDDFFDAIELKGYGEQNAEAKALLDQSHLKVCYGAQPRLLGPKLNPNAIDEEERKKAEATLLEAIDEAEYLSMAMLSCFQTNITAGRGYIAMVACNLARSTPYGAALSSIFFGFFNSLQTMFQNVNFPSQILMAMPYFFTLLASLVQIRSLRGPTAVGSHYDDE